MSNLPAVREENAFELGKVFAESGMFPNVRKAAEAVVKIIAGREFGLGPMAAMNGIHMVDGKPTLAANLIAGQIKRHPRYDYKVIRREADGCELEFFENEPRRNQPPERVSLGTMTWNKKDADAAGLLGKMNWKKYPRDMYFARCLTSGARTFCPDVLGGSPIYTAEELGADDATAVEVPAAVPVTLATGDRLIINNPPVADIPEAEVVPANVIGQDVLDQLRATMNKRGADLNTMAWFLLSVGVESLPENPAKDDILAAMRGLTLEQAFKLEALLKGEDESTPGSGEAA